MRILCINLQKATASPTPFFRDAFLRFSSKVTSREQVQSDGTRVSLIFLDVSASSHLFAGEENMAREVWKLARRYYPEATVALSDTPQGAQALAHHHEFIIAQPAQEKEELAALPITSLLSLEGLVAWEEPSRLYHVVSLFQILGLEHLGELYGLKAESFRERWGKVGETLWKRLHQMDPQVISPLIPSDPLKYYVHLDAPLSLLSFLLYYLEKGFSLLVDRLHGRGLVASKIQLHLRCEYSDKAYSFELALTPASRDLKLFLELVENQLGQVNLENPVREIEIELMGVPETIQQTDFFAKKSHDNDKLQRLVHLFRQRSVKSGFLKVQNGILPENSLAMTSQPEEETRTQHLHTQEGEGLRRLPAHGLFPQQLPRPTRLLDEPEPLSKSKVHELSRLFPKMTERLEKSEWQNGNGQKEVRDYQFALSPKGQVMWIFQNQKDQKYYLHGYCD